MAEISFEPFTLIGDDGKFVLNEDGGKIVGVLLTGDTIPRGEKFFELPTGSDVEVAIAMLKEYVSRKKASGICGVRPAGGILVGVVPQDFDDDTYKEFTFSCHVAECTAFDLVKDFCKYQFGYDSTNDDWESPLK